jgi:hypothetical protein
MQTLVESTLVLMQTLVESTLVLMQTLVQSTIGRINKWNVKNYVIATNSLVWLEHI